MALARSVEPGLPEVPLGRRDVGMAEHRLGFPEPREASHVVGEGVAHHLGVDWGGDAGARPTGEPPDRLAVARLLRLVPRNLVERRIGELLRRQNVVVVGEWRAARA